MRVITGSARGRRLQTLGGNDTRPTTGVVKEAVFSAVQFEVEGSRVLDLFAGSGQMGIEALSRGAVSCVLVDASREAVAIIRQNLEHTRLAHLAKVYQSDALAFLDRNRQVFDLAFLDPPYAAGLLNKALERVAPHMSPVGAVICESPADAQLPERAGDLALYRRYRYSKTGVSIYRRPAEG